MYDDKIKIHIFSLILLSFVISINSMELTKYNNHKRPDNLKIIRHSNGKTVFCMPIIPNESEKDGRAGFVINTESSPYRLIGTFPGARYRQCVEHALLSKNGKYFVFVTGAQYRSAADFIKNVFVVDTGTFQTVDMISYQNVVSTHITMNDDGAYLTIPKKHGGSMLYDIMHHKHIV